MAAVRGEDTMERLKKLDWERKQFTHDELVDLQISYAARLKAAEESMRNQ